MKFTPGQLAVIGFSALYLVLGAAHFWSDLNIEFVIYVGVIVAMFALVFGTLHITRFPTYVLALLSFWGLLHILGGAVATPDGVLFAYRIYPVLDNGGDFYILKYDQLVHGYLYGVMSLVFIHLLRRTLGATGPSWLIALIAVMASMGVSAMNEIMEFLIAVNLERNGVGGYENAMLDLIFNFGGAFGAVLLYWLGSRLFRKAT
ncbi:MAG TPA: DUF2238 domain-containing protein [Candidatus Paceibacterota bacterium]|jgi:putative membrane protein